MPRQKHQPLPGKVIGILLADPQPVLSAEGRFGPADQLCFASGPVSYRWVYVTTDNKPLITNLQVPVGEKGQIKVYPALNMANLAGVARWGITRPYTLVEVEVNDGQGSPANDSFVATDMKIVEGTKPYPLKTTAVVQDGRRRYADYVKNLGPAIEQGMEKAAALALQGRQATGPREKEEIMYVTWLPEKDRLRIHFRTKISDGAYSWVEGGAKIGIDPPPLPRPKTKTPPPKPKGPLPPPPPIAQPPRFKVRVGTTFGIELGLALEFAKDGQLVQSKGLPIQSFRQVLPRPPAVSQGGPFPLPVLPKKREN